MIVKCTSQIAVFTLLFFAIFMDVEAQSFSCPDNYDGNEWSLVQGPIGVRLKSDLYTTEAIDKIASIPYYFTQGSGNNFTVLLDWNTLTNNMKPISDKTAKDLIMMRIAIFNFNGGFPCNGNTNPQDVYLVNFVSQAQCSVTTSCLSLLKYDDEIPCPNHSELQDRIIRNNLSGEGYWRQFRTKPCGFTV